MDLALKRESARASFSLGMASRFDVATVVMICVSIVTGYLVLPPLYSVIQTSLFTTKLTGEIDQFTLRYYEDLFRELQVIGPFLNTFYFSIGSALCATLLGGSIAWIVVRTDSPLRGLGYFTAFASFGTPFILYTIGWLLLLGKAGPVNYWLKILFDQTGPVLNVYSMFGMILIESLLWSPFVFLMLAAAFRSMDPSLEEASAACGARVWQTMRRVSLRLMLPAFFSVMLLIFIRTFESFEIPALVGLPGDIRVLTTSIYLDAQKLPPRYGSAGAFSVLLMVVVAATLVFLFSPYPGRGPLPDGDGERLPADADQSRPLALPGGCRPAHLFDCLAGAAVSDHPLGFGIAILHAAIARGARASSPSRTTSPPCTSPRSSTRSRTACCSDSAARLLSCV